MYIIIGIVALLGLAVMSMYNKFVKLKNQVQEAWSGIDVQLKRRYDLIPNLVETVKGYATHEKEVFNNLAEARSRAIGVPKQDVAGQANAENMLGNALKSVFAVAEAYPDLRSNTNFLQLQDQLASVEDAIEKSRRYYNAVVRDNNTYRESVPSSVIGGMFNFDTYDYFEIDRIERENVQVKF